MRAVLLVGLVLLLTGCDSPDRVSRLEKENQELKAQMVKDHAAASATANLDLQAKCSKDGTAWFSEHWPADKDTIILRNHNHYNASLNKCFVLVEYHYKMDHNGSWTNDMSLWDVYENSQYGSFAENHLEQFKPEFKITNEVITCDFGQNKCKGLEEFNGLVRPYLNN